MLSKYNKNKYQSLLSFLIVFLILTFSINGAYAININSGSAILMESKTGKILYEKNSDLQRPMASTSKIMTYLLTMDAVEDGKISLNDRVKVSRNAANAGGSSYGLKENEVLTVDELLKSMMIISANDSAVVLGEYLEGSIGKFCIEMNEKAKSLGLNSAYFVNPNGMPLKNNDQNKISAKDLALLSKHVIDTHGEHLLGITSQKQFRGKYKNFTKNNTNRLLQTPGFVDGLKTGYTNSAGHCLVTTSEIKDSDENRLISVVLGGKTGKQRYDDSQNLIEYGLNNFHKLREISVLIDDIPIIFDTALPLIKDSTTLIPLRKVSESLGAKIEWDEENKTITGTKKNKIFILTLDSNLAKINGESIELIAAPLVIEGSTMVPARFIAESLDMYVEWQEDIRTVKIYRN